MKKTLLFLFSFLVTANAQEIKLSGYGAAGYRYINRIRIIEANQETYFEGKVQGEFEVNKHIKAQIDFRGNSEDQRVELREFSAKFSYISRLNFEVGNIKKPFGSEYIEKEEDNAAIERSYLTEAAGRIGYNGRSVGVMAYYKTKDEKEFPHSYYFYFYKNNNQQNGLTARYVHHFDDLQIGGNYFMLNTGGDYTILTHGFASNILYKKKKYFAELELMVLQDPVEGIRGRLQKLDDKVFSWGGRLSYSYIIDIDGSVIDDIEPLFLFSYFQPDMSIATQHTVQAKLGVNFYFDKDVRLRFNADALFTRNEYSQRYSSHDSRIVLELQVRY